MPRPDAFLELSRDPRDRLIVALDVDTVVSAERLIDRLDGRVRHFKIGSQLFTASGPAAVEAVQKRGGEVFLDLKFHDIPNTVAGAAREAVDRKSTRLNSSHLGISYAVFCLKKKKK